EEIENLILAHPGVFNAAAVAMPDAILGERTCAYVILRPGASLTLAELVTFLHAQQIAKFKLPERLEVVDAFPLTGVGKVSKKDLREDITRKLAAEAERARSRGSRVLGLADAWLADHEYDAALPAADALELIGEHPQLT